MLNDAVLVMFSALMCGYLQALCTLILLPLAHL